MFVNLLSLGVAAVLAVARVPLGAQPAVTTHRVQVEKGETGATVEGMIEGDRVVDHTLRAAAGQRMVVKLRPGNPSTYFNVLPPGGEYTISVYLMRSAARRNESTRFTLDIGISGDVEKSHAPAAPLAATARVG